MNLSITHTTTWKGVQGRHFLAPLGAGLAVAAILAVGALSALNLGGSSTPSAPKSSFFIAPGMVQPSPAMTYYIVGSEEERTAVVAQATWRLEDNAEYYPEKHWSFEVLVAGTGAEEVTASATLADVKARWTAVGATGLEILDLRQDEPRRNLALPLQPIIIYLVDSQTRADEIVVAARNELTNDADEPLIFAFKATTPDEESSVGALISSWFGRDIQVVDHRAMTTTE